MKIADSSGSLITLHPYSFTFTVYGWVHFASGFIKEKAASARITVLAELISAVSLTLHWSKLHSVNNAVLLSIQVALGCMVMCLHSKSLICWSGPSAPVGPRSPVRLFNFTCRFLIDELLLHAVMLTMQNQPVAHNVWLSTCTHSCQHFATNIYLHFGG